MSGGTMPRMKPSATLSNVARGGIVDDAALARALRQRRIAAAGLDVFEGEPAVHPELLALPNVVLTPHIASASLPTRRRWPSWRPTTGSPYSAPGRRPASHRRR
jgi:gluconate 2-dehydrogenase